MLVINAIVAMLGKDSVNSTVVIIVAVCATGVIALPMLGFLIFHIYLTVSGKTTRELIKKIDNSEINKKGYNVQWCNVDKSIVNFYEEITEEDHEAILKRLNTMKYEGGA
jgi:hypothetical protein